MTVKVSVSITTYNHGPYIAQALDSVLAQRTDFPFEILVGEDNSSDDTRAIVQDYAARYPDRIRLFLHDRSQVFYFEGKPTGRWNLVNNLRHAQGKYVAWLDGDDYWTSPNKLQLQADLLDAHSDYAQCFHAITREDIDGQLSFIAPPARRARYTVEDLLRGDFIASCSVMFRNGLFSDLPDWYYQAPMGDWPLHVINALHGDIGYIDQAMAVHRIHGGSIWSASGSVFRRKRIITTLELYRSVLPPKYTDCLNRSIAEWQLKIINSYRLDCSYGEAAWHALDFLKSPTVPRSVLVRAALEWAARRNRP